MGMYSEKVMDHFAHPRNVGEMPDANGVGEISGGGNTARVLLREGALLSLPGGKTEFTVRCYSTMRNRFGPFHCASGAEDAISMYSGKNSST